MGSSVTNPSRTYVTLTLSHRGVIVQVTFPTMSEFRYAAMLDEYDNQTKRQEGCHTDDIVCVADSTSKVPTCCISNKNA